MAQDVGLSTGQQRFNALTKFIEDCDRRIAEADATIATAKAHEANSTTLQDRLFLPPSLGGFTEKFLDGVALGTSTPSEPDPTNSSHPTGTLKADDKGVVTTPGGYKIEATKQHEWIITGPDNKTTRVWGDPHVDEGDGGKWDFKRDSTFVLADGTRINVKTTPWKDGTMTVTKGLEIISGNERVQISDVDKGKGKTGSVTHDGYANVNSFGGKDVFVMGKETDDWSFKGKEVVGSENGGESFKLGLELQVGEWRPDLDLKPADTLGSIFDGLSKLFSGLRELVEHRTAKPQTSPNDRNCWTRHSRRHQNPTESWRETFRSLGQMFQRLADAKDLSSALRSRPISY